MRVPQPDGRRGSLKWIQRLIDGHAEILDAALRDAGALKPGLTVDWVSPRRDDEWAEYRDGSFLTRLGLSQLRVSLRRFWPARGPQWDALGRSDAVVFLLEAKAHAVELVSTCTARAPASRALIERSLRDTRTALGARKDGDWLTEYYQFANRMAHLRFLREQGIEAYLVLVYFVGDTEMRGPGSRQDWQDAIDAAHRHLGIHGRSSVPGLVELYIDVAELSSTTDRHEPMSVQSHPAGYEYRRRFPSRREVFKGEGGVVYAADGPEGPAVISDEGTLGDLLSGEDSLDLVTIRVFATQEARDSFVARTYGPTA